MTLTAPADAKSHFAQIDANGALQGFYHSALRKPPAGAVDLTDAQYQQWLAGQSSLVWDATTKALVAAPARTPVSAPVPTAVTAFRIKAALLAMPGAETGKTLLDDVNAWIATQSAFLQLAWSTAPRFKRTGTLVSQATTKFGWSSTQLDSIFQAASKITA